MESELSRCSKIVSNLLAFSRKSTLEFREVDVNELVLKCVLLSEHQLTLQNIRVETRLSEGLPSVQGDFNQLQQCLFNLILNSIDAMPQGGSLTLRTYREDPKGRVVMEVRDTGCGIAEEDLPYIFDPFFTTKTEGKGLGLGLSTVYGIVDRHGGTIEARSRPGEGSVFVIRLPLRVGGERGSSDRPGKNPE